MRRALVLILASAGPLAAGCVGDTDPASHIRATQVQLNAHGHSNTGPAKWWWEYSVRKATVANGSATRTPVSGPGSSAKDVAVSAVVRGLFADQPYYFRACGQDTKAGSGVQCGEVRRFRTAPADSTIGVASGALRFTGATNVRHNVTLESLDETGRNLRITESLPDATQQDPPLTGSTFVPGANCAATPDDRGYDAIAYCFMSAALDLSASLGPGDDVVTLATETPATVTLHLGAGNDGLFGLPSGGGPQQIYGDDGSDNLNSGAGNDDLYGGAGDDRLNGNLGTNILVGGPGHDTFVCGPQDIALVDSGDEAAQAGAAGCKVQAETSANLRAAIAAQERR